MKKQYHDVSQAAAMLDDLGSRMDPIWHEGTEVTPDDLSYAGIDKPAEKVKIVFSVGGGDWAYGSLWDMVLDRQNKPHKAKDLTKAEFAKRTKPSKAVQKKTVKAFKKLAPVTSKCYHGDCLKVLRQKVDVRSAHLAILDPPYNMGKNYDSYEDKQKVSDYLDWISVRIAQVEAVLRPDGAMWIFINDGLVSEVDLAAKTLRFHKRNHVIWHYTFGQHHSGNFTASHTHLLYYTRSRAERTFNADAIRVPSARQLKYKDKRADPRGRVPDNTWVLFPEQLPSGWNPAGDTWLESRVCGTFHEREPHSPNQIPVPIMERIVLTTSDPGDLVIDPFCGSGSCGVACKHHGRSYVGIDVSKRCIEQSKRRIDRA